MCVIDFLIMNLNIKKRTYTLLLFYIYLKKIKFQFMVVLLCITIDKLLQVKILRLTTYKRKTQYNFTYKYLLFIKT